MNTILTLIQKDLLRDVKNPLGVLILMVMPILMASMMGAIFAGGDDGEAQITIHVALLDYDEEFFSQSIRSMSNQQQGGGYIQIHPVESLQDGFALLEDGTVSAVMVLPENMTEDLINGATTAIEIYPNPAQRIMPGMIVDGSEIFASAVSGILNLAGDELKTVHDLIDEDEYPGSWEIAMLFYGALQKFESIKTYAFPPILQMRTVNAKDYVPSASATIETGGEG